MTEPQEDPFLAAPDSTANDTYALDVAKTMTTSSALPYQDDHVHVEVPSTSQALVGAAKRKRGRPKKYNSPEELQAAKKAYYKNNAKKEKTTEYSSNNVDENGKKKKRGRPKKSDGEAELAAVRAALGRSNTGCGEGCGVIDITDGEDIVQKLAFPQGAGSVLNVVSAVGFVRAASLRTSEDPSGQSIEYQGHFEVMSLSGAYAWTEYREKVGALSTILRSPEGQFLGGGVSRYLVAAGPVQVQVSTCQWKPPRKAIAASGTRGAAYVCNGPTPALMHCDVYRPVIETSQGYMFTRTDNHQNNGTASAPHMVSQAVAHQHSNGDYITSQADAQQNSASTNTFSTYMASQSDNHQNIAAPASQSDNHQNVAAAEGTNDMVPKAGQAEDGAPRSSLSMEIMISRAYRYMTTVIWCFELIRRESRCRKVAPLWITDLVTQYEERRYLLKEFPELVSCPDHSKLLEVGCGNGSTVLPILRGKPKVKVYACDCSTEALERTKENIEAAELDGIADRFVTFSCDFATAGFPKWLVCDPCKGAALEKSILRCAGNEGTDESDGTRRCVGGFDFIILVFTLSAVPQQMMPRAIAECFSVLKPVGLLLFRDYGLYDMTMLRFDPEKQVGFREYMRSDGTRSYFFSLDMVRVLFAGVGFIKVFTLSAVPQQMMPRAIAECFSVLKPGGLHLFRDYGSILL